MQLWYAVFRYRKQLYLQPYVSHGLFTLGGPTMPTYFDNHTAKCFTLLTVYCGAANWLVLPYPVKCKPRRMRERLEVYNSAQNRRWVQAFLSACLCFPTRRVQSIGLRCYEKYVLLFRRISVVKKKIWNELCYCLYCENPLRSNPLCLCISCKTGSIHSREKWGYQLTKQRKKRIIGFASCFVGINQSNLS